MKIINLQTSLSGILKDDNKSLIETSKHEQQLKSLLNSKNKEYEETQNREKALEHIFKIKQNILKIIYSFLPLVELPIIITTILLIVLLQLNPITGFYYYLLVGLCLLDSIYNIGNNYKKICITESIIKRVVCSILSQL